MRSRQQRPHAVIPGARRDQAGQVGDQEGQGAQAGQGGGPGGPGGEGRPGRLVAQGLSAPLTTKKRARPISHRNVSAMTVRFFTDRKSTRLNSSHVAISYAVFCLKKKRNAKMKARRDSSQC